MTLLFYITIEAISCLFFWMGQNLKKIKYLFHSLSFLILFLVVVLRSISVGTDYLNYIYAINRVATNTMLPTDKNWLGLGFRELIIIIAKIFPTSINSIYFSIGVIGLITFLTLLFFFLSFNNNGNEVFELYLFLCFCLYFQLMNQFRQMFAISIVFFSYRYIGKSFIKYMLLIVLAALFHGTAIIMLPMYFLYKIKLNRKTFLFYGLISILVLVFSPFIKSLIQYTSYSNYLGWTEFDTAGVTSTVLNLIVRISLMVICLIFSKNIIKNDNRKIFLYHMIIICSIVQMLTITSYLFTRITTYFFVFYISLIPDVVNEMDGKFTKDSVWIERTFIYIFFFVYQIVYYLAQSNAAGYSVYKLI